MVTAGRPHYGRLIDMDSAQARLALNEHLLLIVQIARHAATKLRPGGTLLFMGGTGGRRPGVGLGIVSWQRARKMLVAFAVKDATGNFPDREMTAALEVNIPQLRKRCGVRSRGRPGNLCCCRGKSRRAIL